MNARVESGSPFPKEYSELEESSTRSNVLLRRDGSGYHLKISRERSSRFAGSMATKHGKSHQEVCEILSHLDLFGKITTLHLSGCKELEDRDLERVANVTSLTEINLSEVNISVHMLKQLLNANQQVEKLVLQGNRQIEKKDLQSIFLLGRNLKHVDFTRCPQLKDEDVMNVPRNVSMALVLPSGRAVNIWAKTTAEIYVPSANYIYSLIETISDEKERWNIQWIVNGLLQPYSKAHELCIAQCGIGDDGARVLAAALKVNRLIQKLDFSDNAIGDKGVEALGVLLEANPWIRELNLSKNQIGVEGAQALVMALGENQTLLKLDLSQNQIGVKGTRALAIAIKVNRLIQQLMFHKDQIGEESVEALVVAFKTDQILTNLSFHCDRPNYPFQIVYTITAVVQANRRIKSGFREQLKKVQKFFSVHRGDESITFQHLRPLQALLQKWHRVCYKASRVLKKIENFWGKVDDQRKVQLEGHITDLVDCLHELWLELFEYTLIVLSNEYVTGQESSGVRNNALGYALYEIWYIFVGSSWPNWLEDHLEWLIPFGVLLDIAEGGEKKDISTLTDVRSLFKRILSFKDEKLKK